MAYATTQDLESYIGTTAPTDAERLLERASELVDYYTLNRIDTDDTVHAGAAKNAVCAQVEYWIELDESLDKTGAPESLTIGSFSMQGKLSELAPRARRFLLNAGLLYSGVDMT